MLRIPILLALFMTAGSCLAETFIRTPGESVAAFAMRAAPPNAVEMVTSVESAEWTFSAPAIAAFYRRPVIYADKSHNYGSDPNDYEVIGVLFIPVARGGYERVEIDSYGPEGSSAEIDQVQFTAPQDAVDSVLVVHVSWHPRPGGLKSACAYARPLPQHLPKTLARAKGYDCHP